MKRGALLVILVACGAPHRDGGQPAVDAAGGGGDGAHGGSDAAIADGAHGGGDGGGSGNDGGGGGHDAQTGVITGGPCMSGAAGATAYRILWKDGGGSAYPVYEVNGLPDKSRDHTGAYGYTIPFTAQYVDPFLGEGGLQLDGSDFVDIEISTQGVSSIASATLALYGRSYNTTASGSFNWMTFVGYNETATNSVSNVAPYHWDSGDMTMELAPNDSGTLIRIKAGPSSEALVVHRIEICMQAS